MEKEIREALDKAKQVVEILENYLKKSNE